MCKILNKQLTYSNCSKKCSYVCKILQDPQLLILLTWVGSSSCPLMVHLCPNTIISSMQRVVLYPENVLPEYFILCTTLFESWKCSQTSSNTRIFRNRFWFSISLYILCCWSSCRNVVDIWLDYMQNLQWKDVINFIMKDGYRVCLAHR